ncbi:uncharacterized protein LOC129271398 [Lytechinus pictus]|uniref:uncharacterized protein LOC129271398 n=1 Tax=Lytechinus pictus TaxID=7653 RepID=UPI0030BA2031
MDFGWSSSSSGGGRRRSASPVSDEERDRDFGTGRRSKAEPWEKGVSGKQNKTFVDGTNRNRSVAYIFTDSQLRPVVQGEVELPPGPVHMIINSTPGGTCRHVEEELLEFRWELEPDVVLVAAGTNNIGFGSKSLGVACKQFRGLLRSARRMTPLVLASSIAPRLDRKGRLVDEYNDAFYKICNEEGATWLDITDSFPMTERILWARDGLHISECTGLPRLLRVWHRRMVATMWPGGS